MQAGIYWLYAYMISRLPKMPKNTVFSRNFGLLLKRQMYRNLLQIGVISHRNGVVNGVVDCSWFGDGDVKYHKEKSVETHVFAERRMHGFCDFKNRKNLKFRKRRWKKVFGSSPPFWYLLFLKIAQSISFLQ